MPDPLLSLAHIGKAFGATRALIDAELTLHAGEVTALVGENGAGKSTLVKIIAGLYEPDSGEIRVGGDVARIRTPAAARDLGISVVHQESVLFDNLSVAENILIDSLPTRRGLVNWRELRRRATSILAQLDSPLDADQLVGNLSVAQKHLVQIARGLSRDARIVILDEPTAALSHREAEDLHGIVQRLKARGCAILLISHRFEEIFAVADRYAVFRDGRSVGEGRLRETTPEELIGRMIGRAMDQVYPPRDGARASTTADEVLRVENLCRDREFHDITFSARRGEILGFYGLIGAGRSEVMQCVFGLTRAHGGRVVLPTKPGHPSATKPGHPPGSPSPGQPSATKPGHPSIPPNPGQPSVTGSETGSGQPSRASRTGQPSGRGLAYVPEDRQQQGAILSFSIAANIALPNLARLSCFGVQRRSAIKDLARHWIEALQIKADGPHQNVEALSGGNQQKVILAKWLSTNPTVLIVDEPTKGIDVGAKAAVHEVLRNLASRGMAVVMISSDLPEVLGMSDRVIVMRRGHIRAEFTREDASAEALAHAATAA